MPAIGYPAMLDLVARGMLRPQELPIRAVDFGEAARLMSAAE